MTARYGRKPLQYGDSRIPRYKIETGIPIPAEHVGKGFAATLRALKKGQSVVLPTSRKNLGGIISSIGGIGGFTVRTLSEKRVRVWRIK